MKTYEERREEERKYQGDVAYEVWRHGGNMDAVNPDRVSQYHADGLEVDSAALRELRAQHARQRRHEEAEQEQQQWPEDQLPDEQP